MKKSKKFLCFLFAGVLLLALSCKNDKPNIPTIEAQVFRPGYLKGYAKQVGIAYILKHDSIIIIGAETAGLYTGVGPGYIPDALYIYYQTIPIKLAVDAYKAHITKPVFPFDLYLEDGNTREPFHVAIFLELDGEIESIKEGLHIFYGPNVVTYQIIGDSIHTTKTSYMEFYRQIELGKDIGYGKKIDDVFMPF